MESARTALPKFNFFDGHIKSTPKWWPWNGRFLIEFFMVRLDSFRQFRFFANTALLRRPSTDLTGTWPRGEV